MRYGSNPSSCASCGEGRCDLEPVWYCQSAPDSLCDEGAAVRMTEGVSFLESLLESPAVLLYEGAG